MGGNIGALRGVIRGIVERGGGDPNRQGFRRQRRPQDGRGTFLGGIQPFGGQRRGGGLFGGAASTAAQQTFGT